MIKFRGCSTGRTLHGALWNFIEKSFRNSLDKLFVLKTGKISGEDIFD
jgi:hypothetical protein